MVKGAVLATARAAQAAMSARCGPVSTGSPRLSICATMSMLSSIGAPSSLTRIGMTRLPARSIMVALSSSRTTVSCERPALERRRHAHAKAQRAMLEQIKPHAALSLRRTLSPLPLAGEVARAKRAPDEGPLPHSRPCSQAPARRPQPARILRRCPLAILGSNSRSGIADAARSWCRSARHRSSSVRRAEPSPAPAIAQAVEMKRQRIGREAQLVARSAPAASPSGPALHQEPEHVEPVVLRQRRQAPSRHRIFSIFQ